MNKKQVIRINENQLKQIVAESVKKVLNEIGNPIFDPPYPSRIKTSEKTPENKRFPVSIETRRELMKYGKLEDDNWKTYTSLYPKEGVNIENLKNFLETKYPSYKFILTNYPQNTPGVYSSITIIPPKE